MSRTDALRRPFGADFIGPRRLQGRQKREPALGPEAYFSYKENLNGSGRAVTVLAAWVGRLSPARPYEPNNLSPTWFHARRVARGHRHHWRARCAALAGGSGSSRGVAASQ